MSRIQKEHFALIIKYTGISFITWGLSHWFFSGERQILTSLVGIVLFIIGTLLEKNNWEKEYLRTIMYSSVFAVSIGALTGGLQHFPDSPERSLWIVPVGFILSFYSYLLLEKHPLSQKNYTLYALVGFAISIIVSLSFYWVVDQWYFTSEHSHTESHSTVSETSRIDTSGTQWAIQEEVHIDGHGHDH